MWINRSIASPDYPRKTDPGINPGMNAVAGLHDAWGRYDWLYDGFLNSGGLIGASGTVWNLAGAMGVVYWSASIDYHYVY